MILEDEISIATGLMACSISQIIDYFRYIPIDLLLKLQTRGAPVL